MTRRQLMDFYVEVIETAVGDIDKHSRLCQACEDIVIKPARRRFTARSFPCPPRLMPQTACGA